MQDWKNYKKVLLPDIANLNQIEVYEANGGYAKWKEVITGTGTHTFIKKEEKVLEDGTKQVTETKEQVPYSPKVVVDIVKSANVRGRGGAGFNAGLKWSFMPPKKEGVRRYLAINGDESEPGSFKDRRLMEFNPHLVIEGILFACYAMEMDAAYIYIRGEYVDYLNFLEKAVFQAYQKGYVGKNILGSGRTIDIYVHRGAGAYICGEETSLMESLEGKRAYPRSKPPFPAQKGLWGCPTTINNVDTMAQSALVMRYGAEWYASIGAKTHPGPFLYGISGHINRPGIYEYPTGMLITDLVYKVAGGMKNGKKLKAVIPGGVSVPILRADMIEGVRMDTDSLAAAGLDIENGKYGFPLGNRKIGSMMGTGGMVVMNEDTDMVKLVRRISQFFHHESCGQCTPCREGTGWLEKLIIKIDEGRGEMKDLDLLFSLTENMEGRTVCMLADASAWPVRATIIRFREEFEAKVKNSVYAVS